MSEAAYDTGTLAGMADDPVTVPRGRHAPPLEVRLDVQRRRLFLAAAQVFSRQGYAEASAEAISREAGMSKATFYEHFANKEECILALADASAAATRVAVAAAIDTAEEQFEVRARARVRAFLDTVAGFPEMAKVVLIEIVGAGARGAERRDAMLQAFADFLDEENKRANELYGAPRFASRDDAYAIVGAIVELASRQLRTGHPKDIRELEPVVERLVSGVLAQSAK
jgi:AcrR family transcriptional regulator